MTVNISFIGQSTAQIQRLKTLNNQLYDLQRQMTTQKKTTTFSGLGFDSLGVQRYRMDINSINTYGANIDTATTRIKMMSTGLTRASTAARDALATLQTLFNASPVDVQTLKDTAQQSLDLIRDISNLDIDGRYLFAGSGTSDKPVSDPTLAPGTMQTQIASWLSGGQTTSQIISAIDGYSDTQLGFNPALTSAGSVTMRIDTQTTIDYTSLPADNGMSDAIRALAVMANIQLPNPATDVATQSDMQQLLDHVGSILSGAITKMDRANTVVGSKFDLINSIKDMHKEDSNLYQTLVADKENADTTEVAAALNSLQTQLQASYQVTNMVSKMSLVNFLTP